MSRAFTRTVALFLSLQIMSIGTPWPAANADRPCGNQMRPSVAPLCGMEEQALSPALAAAQFRRRTFQVMATAAVIVTIHALLTHHGLAALGHHGFTAVFAAVPIIGRPVEEEEYPFKMNELDGKTEFKFKLPQRILDYLWHRPTIEGTPSAIMTNIIKNVWLGRGADGPQTIKRRVDHYEVSSESDWKNSGFVITNKVAGPFVASLQNHGWMRHLPYVFIALVDHATQVAEMKRAGAIEHIITLAREVYPSVTVKPPLKRAQMFAIAVLENRPEAYQALSDNEVSVLQKILVDDPSDEQLARSMTTRTKEVSSIGARHVVHKIASRLHPNLFTDRFLRSRPTSAAAPDRLKKAVNASA